MGACTVSALEPLALQLLRHAVGLDLAQLALHVRDEGPLSVVVVLTPTAIEIGGEDGSSAGVGVQGGVQPLRDAAHLSQAQPRVLERFLVV